MGGKWHSDDKRVCAATFAATAHEKRVVGGRRGVSIGRVENSQHTTSMGVVCGLCTGGVTACGLLAHRTRRRIDGRRRLGVVLPAQPISYASSLTRKILPYARQTQ